MGAAWFSLVFEPEKVFEEEEEDDEKEEEEEEEDEDEGRKLS